MAILGFPHPRRRHEYSAGAYNVRAKRGQLIASVWPHEPTQRSAAQKTNEHYFRAGIHSLATPMPGTNDVTAEYAKMLGMRTQDFRYAMATGSIWYWTDEKGRVFTGQAWRDMMTHMLDVVCPGLGTPLMRYGIGWAPISAGDIGDVLTATNEGPAWAGKGGMWNMAENTTAAIALSRSLDTLGALPGGIAYRGPDRWTSLDIGQPGEVLTVGPDLLPVWAPPAP